VTDNALTLVGLPYSPWSEKARWALDHHQVGYRFREYSPLLGELGLRLRLGKLSGPVSVPVLFGGAAPVPDSLAIAREAERLGRGSPLFPTDGLDAVVEWNDRSEEALAIGRGLSLDRARQSPAAKEAFLPSFVPEALRPIARPMASIGIAYVARKYRARQTGGRAELIAVMETLQRALRGPDSYLLGRMSYADIAMAASLQFFAPAADDHLPLAPGIRQAWTDAELVTRFADVLRWRDWLYRTQRRPRG
jgi:glutathione S-transferase